MLLKPLYLEIEDRYVKDSEVLRCEWPAYLVLHFLLHSPTYLLLLPLLCFHLRPLPLLSPCLPPLLFLSYLLLFLSLGRKYPDLTSFKSSGKKISI